MTARDESSRDWVGWACLVVVVPPLWLGAPLVLAFTVVRAFRADEVRGPTIAALMVSAALTLFWAWYALQLVNGAHP